MIIFCMTDYMVWYNDIINRNPSASVTHVTDGDGYIATALFNEGEEDQYSIKSGWAMSLWDIYKDLCEKLRNGDDRPFPISTTAQRDALSGILKSTIIYNETTDECETWTATSWVSAAGEKGAIIHLATSTVTTTDNTQTTINTITLDEDSAYLFTSEIIGETEDHSIVAGFIIEVTAKRLTGGSAEIIGNVTTTHSGKDSGASSWNVDFTVSGNDLSVSVTGGNATTVLWECDLNYLEY